VYADKFIILDSDQTQVFNRDATPGKLQRVIGFDQVSLDCNVDGNKLCTVKELQAIEPTFTPVESVKAFNGYQDKCLVVPIIDNTERPTNQELFYLCYQNALQSQVYLDRSKFSRMID